MRVRSATALASGLVVTLAASSACANRITVEVWPDAYPDHAVSCSIALADGWISLVQVKGAGMPGPAPMRWPASDAEVDALSDGLQAFVGGALGSVDAYRARQPPAPFLTVTWMAQLDDRLTTGLYIQPGLSLPPSLSRALSRLGVGQPCGLSARSGE